MRRPQKFENISNLPSSSKQIGGFFKSLGLLTMYIWTLVDFSHENRKCQRFRLKRILINDISSNWFKLRRRRSDSKFNLCLIALQDFIIIFKWQQRLIIDFKFKNGWADFCWKSYLRTSSISLIRWKLFRSKTLHFCRLFSSW